MIALAWIVAALWGLRFLASARIAVRRLPEPTPVVAPYALWLPDGGAAPTLDPPPTQVIDGPQLDAEGPDRVLVLAGGVQVDPALPGRLAACGCEWVSVLPIPHGGPLGLARERMRRDVTRVEWVLDPSSPVGFADGRCAWLRRRDLALPGVGEGAVLRAARARKAHGLAVDLRDGRAVDGVVVSAPATDRATLRAQLADLVARDPLVRARLALTPLVLVVLPVALLWSPGARPAALLALGLGLATRGMTALRDGFGAALPLLGPLVELALAVEVARAPALPSPPPMPALPTDEPQPLTGAQPTTGGAWLDRAGVPYLARRLGGGAAVMEQIYRNAPAGTGRLGWWIDRAVLENPAARAVRHRWVSTVELARGLRPTRVLSVPCGSARDAAAIGAPKTVLVDPDPHARALAAAAFPDAEVIEGTLADLPDGPFDVILFIGLAEYLDDRVLLRSLEALRDRLAPHGGLLTSTTADHADRVRMRRMLGWETRARVPEDLVRLLEAAGYRVEGERADPAGIQWLFLARPSVSTG